MRWPPCWNCGQALMVVQAGRLTCPACGYTVAETPRNGTEEHPEERAARRERLDTRVRVDLHKAVWEASQVMSYDEIRQLVEGTIAEIVSDEP